MKTILLFFVVLNVYAQKKQICKSSSFNICDCDADGIVDGVITDKPGCWPLSKSSDAGHVCYIHPLCPFPLAKVSQIFNTPGNEIKYMYCDPVTAIESDKCDPSIPAPTVAPPTKCKANNGFPTTRIGRTAVKSCQYPTAAQKSQTRECTANGVWGKIKGVCPAKPTCTDGIMNGDEEGGDCGGSCNKCVKPDPCVGINCGSFGSCNAGKCVCQSSYIGDRCQTPPANKCTKLNIKCQNGGMCFYGTCECVDGYTGDRCEKLPTDGTCYDGIQNGPESGVDCVLNVETDTRDDDDKCRILCEAARFQAGPWSKCNKRCDGGVQTRQVDCVSIDGKITDSGECSGLHPLPSTQGCNIQACATYSYVEYALTPCGKTCGSGTQLKLQNCVSSIGLVVVPDSHCGPRPPTPSISQTCNTQKCDANFDQFSDTVWSACSRTCGGGKMTGTTRCNGSKCRQSDAPAKMVHCNTHPCIGNAKWHPCGWDECTARCNGNVGMIGWRFRQVMCREGDKLDGKVIDPVWCNQADVPPHFTEGCNTQTCTSMNWMMDSPGWGQCIEEEQTRSFHCHAIDGSNALNIECAASLAKPVLKRSCQIDQCVVPWGKSEPSPTSPEPDASSSTRHSVNFSVLAALALGLLSLLSPRYSVYLCLLIALVSIPCVNSFEFNPMSKPEHYTPVTDFSMKQGPNPGKSESGHHTPFGHTLDVKFTACGKQFDYQLSLMDGLLAEDHTATMVHSETNKTTSTMDLHSYHLKSDELISSLTVYDKSTVFAILVDSEDILTITPHDQMIIQHPVLAASNPGVNMWCSSNNEKLIDMNDQKQNNNMKVQNMTARRRLLQTFVTKTIPVSDYFGSSCFNGFDQGKTLKIGMAADSSFSKKVGANNVQKYFQQVFAAANVIYTNQVHVSIKIGNTQVYTGSGPSWNPCGSRNPKLDYFRQWKVKTHPNDKGPWHLMTNCYPPPGTVGLAYLGVLAHPSFAVGWTSMMGSDTWKIFAHELGHNFGGPHSFERGQGKTGGIMDYGNGMNRQPWFNKKLREKNICDQISKALKLNANAFTNGMIGGGPAPSPTPKQPVTRRPSPAPDTSCDNPKADKHNQCVMWAADTGTSDNRRAGRMCTNLNTWMKANCATSCCLTKKPRKVNTDKKVVECGDKNCNSCNKFLDCDACDHGLFPAAKGQVCMERTLAYLYTAGEMRSSVPIGSSSFVELNVKLVKPPVAKKMHIFAGVFTNGVKFSLNLNEHNVPEWTVDDITQTSVTDVPVPAGSTIDIKMSVVENVLHFDVTGQEDHPLLQWPHYDVSFQGAGIAHWKLETKDTNVIKNIEVVSFNPPV